MRPLYLVPLAFAPLVPLHAGPPRLLADSVLGVIVGVVVVGLYLAALRWTARDRSDTAGDRRDAGGDGPRSRERHTD